MHDTRGVLRGAELVDLQSARKLRPCEHRDARCGGTRVRPTAGGHLSGPGPALLSL